MSDEIKSLSQIKRIQVQNPAKLLALLNERDTLREENSKLKIELDYERGGSELHYAPMLERVEARLAEARAENERLKAEVKKLNSECPGCGQIADGWGFCDCAHDFKKEKSGQLRELFSEAVKVLERIANDDACAEHDAREFLAKAKT